MSQVPEAGGQQEQTLAPLSSHGAGMEPSALTTIMNREALGFMGVSVGIGGWGLS